MKTRSFLSPQVRAAGLLLAVLLPALGASAKKASQPLPARSPFVPPQENLPAGIEAHEVKACLESVCGEAKENRSSADTLFERTGKPSLSAKRAWSEKFLPQVKDVLRAEKESRLRLQEKGLEAARKGLKIREDHPARAFLAFQKIYGNLLKEMPTLLVLNMAEGRAVLNTSALRTSLLHLPEVSRLAGQAIMMKYALPLATENIRSRFDQHGINPYLLRFKRLNPYAPVKTSQLNEANALSRILGKLEGRMGGLFFSRHFSQADKDLLAKARRLEDIDAFEGRAYLDLVRRAVMFDRIYNDEETFTLLMNVPLDLNEEVRKLSKKNFFESSLRQVRGQKVEEAVKEVSSLCEDQLTKSLDLSASDLRIRLFRSAISDLKAAAKKVAKRWTDERTEEITLDYIDQIEFGSPETNADRLRRIQTVIDLKKASVSMRQRLLEDSNQADAAEMILVEALSAASAANPEALAKPEIRDLEAACKSLPQEVTSDMSIGTFGEAQISWFSANYPEIGVGIVAHEIGHLVSYALRRPQLEADVNRKFTESLSCVANRNPYQPNPRLELRGQMNTEWSEEDWADHFAVLVMEELAKSGSRWASKKNPNCALTEDFGEMYLMLSPMSPKPEDPHSSAFLRILMTEEDSGNAKPACRKILRKLEASGRKMTCR